MPGRIDFTLDFNTPGTTGAKCNKDTHYRVYVLGSFSGRRDEPWEQRKITAINIDNFEQVMARIKPTLIIDGGFRLVFENPDDFHPDSWLQKIPILDDLLALKRQLSNPNTAEQAAAKIKAFLPVEIQPEKPVAAQAATETQEQTLERLLGRKPETTVAEPDTVERLLQQVVSPHVSKASEPQYRALINIIDATVNEYLRMLLHRQDFQRLESLWKATAGLVNEESADEQSFFLIDIDQDELLAELKSGQCVFEQKLLKHIQSGDGEQEVLLIGDYRFSDSADDGELLGLCSRLANACKGYFLAAADGSLITNAISGESGHAQKWKLYLSQICADSVILAYPRYLLRLPYGVKRGAIETLAFDECSTIPQSGELLWGNPAFLSARVLIRASQQQNAEDPFFFGDIPCFAFESDGEQVLQPGAELAMTENQANVLLSKGIAPVTGYHQRQGVRLLALTTLSDFV